MQCSQCGFVMSELDTECLRCKRLGSGAAPASTLTAAPPRPASPALTAQAMRDEEKECPRCGKATGASVMLCDKCGYEFQPDVNRAERYQRLLAEETAPPASALRRTIPPGVSWSIIGACLLAMGGAGWAMFGAAITGQGEVDSSLDSPIVRMHPRKAPGAAALRSVTYKVTGAAKQAVVTYRGADSAAASAPATVALPWIQNFSAKSGAPLSLSAKPADGSGKLTVEIHVDGVIRQQTDTPGKDGLTAVTDKL